MESRTLNVGVVFGGVAPEHEVSVITAHQAMHALDRARYQPVPLYIGKDGTWYAGDVLGELDAYQDLDDLRDRATRVALVPRATGTLDVVGAEQGGLFTRRQRWTLDVLFLGLHGGSGEDGGVQGLCETFNVPYTGSGVFGSSIGMDKVLTKLLCRDQDIPLVDFVALREAEWGYREEEWLDRIEDRLGYPVIIKPARLGSSIGIGRAGDRQALDAAIEEAFRYDEKLVVERAVQALKEINCAVLGDPNEAQASVLEQPIPTRGDEILSFQDKYMRGGGAKGGSKAVGGAKEPKEKADGMASLDRIIPAPLSDARTAEIRELAVRVFQLFECAGVARIDFMIDEATDEVFFNEINTIPGSFSFYLWEPSGVPFDELTHRMIQLGLQRHRERSGRVRTYDVNLLSQKSLRGLKGAKG